MSSLTSADRKYLEKILDMVGTGYVLDFTDSTYEAFFKQHGVAIHDARYQTYGTSKAKKLRAFWEQEPDHLVGQVLSEMLDTYEALCVSNGSKQDITILHKCREIVGRLTGQPYITNSTISEDFLKKEFDVPDLQKLPVDLAVSEIIKDRLNEARECLSVGAHLAVIFHCGSVLEAILLGSARRDPAKFNEAKSSPKQNGKVKYFHKWSLSEFINVAHEVGLLSPDVKKFSHGLRDFRNYIHPYQQMESGFMPDEHTAKLCLQALRAALADVTGER